MINPCVLNSNLTVLPIFHLIIDDLLEAVKKAADQNKKDAVAVFDEFQEIVSFDGDETEKKMRSAFLSIC